METVKELKIQYPAGTIVKCVHMDDPHGVPAGTVGTVRFVDDAGQIHVNWETGSTLALICGVDDFAVLK